MTDTEILDYLSKSFEEWKKKAGMHCDMQIANVWFTTYGHDSRDVRTCLIQAIERDQGIKIAQVTNKLTRSGGRG